MENIGSSSFNLIIICHGSVDHRIYLQNLDVKYDPLKRKIYIFLFLHYRCRRGCTPTSPFESAARGSPSHHTATRLPTSRGVSTGGSISTRGISPTCWGRLPPSPASVNQPAGTWCTPRPACTPLYPRPGGRIPGRYAGTKCKRIR